jgi:methylenetetrahydrofolate reductase (NADPH)
MTQFSFAPHRVLACTAALARLAPGVPVDVGIAGPATALALLRYARHCGVDVSRAALRQLGTGIAGLGLHTDPADHVSALRRHRAGREHSNVAGVHLFSFGGLAATATWLAHARAQEEREGEAAS